MITAMIVKAEMLTWLAVIIAACVWVFWKIRKW